MSQIVKYTCVELGCAELSCVRVKGKPWIHSNSVTDVLQYASADQALRDWVDDGEQQTYKDLVPTAVSTTTTNVDPRLKSYEGGCPDFQITLPFPSGFFPYVIAFEFKHPNGTGTLFDKQVRCRQE